MLNTLIFLATILLTPSLVTAAPAPTGSPGGPGGPLTPRAQLGQELFFDTALSTPPGQACATCHAPKTSFTDPDTSAPTSKGATPELHGNRNTPTAMYATFSPSLHFDETKGDYVGGQFWDGRVNSLEEQAKGPFLNPLEMANPNEASVVEKVRRARYAPLFRDVYGPNALDDVTGAYQRIANAIAAFEKTRALTPFTSKYDYFLAGRAQLTPQEQRGMKLFEDPNKGNCIECHVSHPDESHTSPLLTTFSYYNVGIPKNPDNPFYTLSSEFNPDGFQFIDLGLGATVQLMSENGKFKIPTLRNIDKTAPYMHNGYFKTLRNVVDFYNTRDVKPRCADPFTRESEALQQGCWPEAEVADTVNHNEIKGALGLSEQEVNDMVAFLKTLTDGYQP